MGRRMVLLLMLVVALGHFNRVGMAVAGAERIIPQYQLAPEKMGLVYSAFLLCYTAAMLPGGWFIDRFGGRVALMTFGFGSACFVALSGCVGLLFREAQSVWLGLLVVRSLLGIVNAPLHPSSARLVYAHVPRSATTTANGWVCLAACVGIAATYFGLGLLMDTFDWPVAFLICSAVTLVIATLWTIGTRTSVQQAATPTGKTLPTARQMARMLGRRSILCLTASYMALGYFQYLFFYWIEYYFETIRRQPVSVSRKYTTLITLAMGVGMLAGGWLADRLPAHWSWRWRRGLVPMAGMFASGLVFQAGLLTSNAELTLLAFAIAAALIGACEGSFWTTIVELGSPYGGTAAGLMNTGGNAGGTLSPYVTPVLGTFFAGHFGAQTGWRWSLAVAGIVVMLGAVLWLGVTSPPEDVAARDAANPA
jgi:MFS family permease